MSHGKHNYRSRGSTIDGRGIKEHMEVLLAAAVAIAAAAIVATLMRSQARRELAEARTELSAALAASKQDNKWLTEEIARQKDGESRLRETFQALSADALKDNRTAFLDLARMSVQQPIEETLKKVERRLKEVDDGRMDAYARLSEQVIALRSSAETLSRSLRTPAVRGQWGEMLLRRVVEIAGMTNRCDFDEQASLTGTNGRLRPDLIVRLPGGKRIVVDAKAPMEAFLDAQEATDDEVRATRLHAHARQVRDHMTKLGSKAYWEPLGDSPEIVVLFLPSETLFSAALQYDLRLIEDGLSQHVLLTSPITLIALLTTVAHTWRQEALAENYRDVVRLGREFYERLATFTGHLDEVRKKLDGAVKAYNDAAGSFENRVLVGARRLKELKVTTADELPPAESIDTVPRVLRQVNLLGLPDDATTEEPDLT